MANTSNTTYKSNYLALSWSTSRGRDTFGYNICRLDDRSTDKRYKCMGGGYDMVGTVVGNYLQEAFQKELLSIQGNAYHINSAKFGYIENVGSNRLYGMLHDQVNGLVMIDGGCGLESVKRIAEAIGVTITSNYNKRKARTEGFFVSWNG